MLKSRQRRLERRSEAAVHQLADIEAAVTKLDDEDLLDFADIFKAEPRTALGEMAFSEMARRGITL